MPDGQAVMGDVDGALAHLRQVLPEFHVYCMGERSRTWRRPFFCGIEPRAGGPAYVGGGETPAQAIHEAIDLALGDTRRLQPGSQHAG